MLARWRQCGQKKRKGKILFGREQSICYLWHCQNGSQEAACLSVAGIVSLEAPLRRHQPNRATDITGVPGSDWSAHHETDVQPTGRGLGSERAFLGLVRQSESWSAGVLSELSCEIYGTELLVRSTRDCSAVKYGDGLTRTYLCSSSTGSCSDILSVCLTESAPVPRHSPSGYEIDFCH